MGSFYISICLLMILVQNCYGCKTKTTNNVKDLGIFAGCHKWCLQKGLSKPQHTKCESVTNNGQTCVCANRIYVQAGVYDAFAEKFAKRIGEMKVGNGMEDGVAFGPLIEPQAVDKVKEHVADALSKGADIILGGKEHELGGLFFEPTIMTNVDRSMMVTQEETFGPLAPLYRFEDDDEVIEQANDTRFGLASYFYSQNLSRVYKVAEALEYGIVGINTGIISTEVAPFGGIKESGLGREGSSHGIDDYLEMKYMCLSV
mgnify:CR=1 FL=1